MLFDCILFASCHHVIFTDVLGLKSQNRKKHVKSVKCEGYAHYYFRLQWHGHHEFFQHDRTINKKYYLKVMRRLRQVIRQKRTELWKTQSWENPPAHASMLVRGFLAKNKTAIMPQPPYSSDWVPIDFFLFPKLKTPMKGMRFATIKEINEKSKQELLAIPKNPFLKCLEDRKNRWHKCIITEEDYFEGKKIVIDK